MNYITLTKNNNKILQLDLNKECVIIPKEVVREQKRYQITSIGPQSFDESKILKSILLPQTINGIGIYSFYNCENLEVINIPQKLTTIGSYAFAFCKSLQRIKLPESMYSIGSHAFLTNQNKILIELIFVSEKSPTSISRG